MADKYEPTADVHNIFIFVLIPIIIHIVLSAGYKRFMKKIENSILIILSVIYCVLPTVIYSYRSNFFEVFGKARFIMTYFALPFLVGYLVVFVILVKRLIFSSEEYKSIITGVFENLLEFRFLEIFITSDFIVNVYYFSYFCQTTFKTHYYLYIVVPISFLYLISFLMCTFKNKLNTDKADNLISLLLICFILKTFVITTIISSSTIVTNSLLTLFLIPVLYIYYVLKRIKSYPESGRSKKLQKFVEELTAQDNKPSQDDGHDDRPSQDDNLASQYDNPGNANNSQFIDLYQKIRDINNKSFRKANADETREVIHHYYSFGKAIEELLDYHKKCNKERVAQALVNEEIRSQLSGKTGYIPFLREKEIAQRIYEFFNVIGEDKIDKIRSFSAVEISELSSDDIDYVLVEIVKKDATLLEMDTTLIDVNPAKKDVILPELMIKDNEEITG